MSDKRIYDFYIASRQSAALAAGVRVGLFDALGSRPCDEAELAKDLGLELRPTRLLVRTLVAMGLIIRQDGLLVLAPDAAAHLVHGRENWIGNLIDLEIECFPTPGRVIDALRLNRPTVYNGADPWQEHSENPERVRRFTEAMHSISNLPARAMARAAGLSGAKRLLDVGGGSGVLSMALARTWPGLHCTVLDLPQVCKLAESYVAGAGLGERIDTLPADMFGEWPGGFDAVLLSQILHDWPEERGRELLRRAHGSLLPGGCVMVHEKLVDRDGTAPLANHLVDIDMLVWSEGQQWTAEELQAVLEGTGFREIISVPTQGYWMLTTARRK